jgi:hypothetical protein
LSAIVSVAVIGVAVAWVVNYSTIWKWGPDVRRRLVRCPEETGWALVEADHRETRFTSPQVVDVKSCSLKAISPLKCSKQCIGRL